MFDFDGLRNFDFHRGIFARVIQRSIITLKQVLTAKAGR